MVSARVGARPRRAAAPRLLRVVVVGSPYDLFAALGEGRGVLEGDLRPARWQLRVVSWPSDLRAQADRGAPDLVVVLAGSASPSPREAALLVRAEWPGVRCALLASHARDAAEAWEAGSGFDLALVGYGRDTALPSLLRLAADRWWGDGTAPALLLVEDDPGWASVALEVLQRHADELEGGRRARTLWARSYEEALACLDRVGELVRLVVSDGEYPRGGRPERLVGLELLAVARRRGVPVLLVSADEGAPSAAAETGVAFVGKAMDSPLDLLRAAVRRAQPPPVGARPHRRRWTRRAAAGRSEVAPPWMPRGGADPADLESVGRGSLGGKGRGLGFLERLLARDRPPLDDVRLGIPPTLVLRTGVCEAFLDSNGLHGLVACASALSDPEIVQAFVRGEVPAAVRRRVGEWLAVHPGPVAVRSSASLEDCRRHPLAGAFAAVLVHAEGNAEERLERVLEAVSVVWASPLCADPRRLLAAAGVRHRPAMAVLVQSLVGRAHGRHFYPTFSGLASSYNYYPFRDMTPEDGVAVVAMGLGKALVDGREGLRFCPRYPHAVPQLGSVKDTLANAQRRMWALDLDAPAGVWWPAEPNLVELEAARELRQGIGSAIASTYLPANDALVDGIREGGAPLVTFARLLRGRQLPLGPALHWLLRELEHALGGPVEIELAMDLEGWEEEPALWLLQCRPLVGGGQPGPVGQEDGKEELVVVRSCAALGQGRVGGLHDVVLVVPDLDRARTVEVAGILERIDRGLRLAGRPYLLLGPGRWGSRDQWLGIPVAWSQVSGARAIVETDFADLIGDPSQGSHFFHHLTAAGIPFLGVHRHDDEGHIDWAWLCAQPAVGSECDGKVRHLHFAEPLEVRVDGRRREGVVVLPARAVSSSRFPVDS